MTKEYRNPALTVDIVVLVNTGLGNNVYLIKRKNAPFGWALPGGFVDYGESCKKAAKRELKEELDLDAEEVIFIGGVYSEPDRDPRQHVVSVPFLAKGVTGIPEAKDDAKAFKLFSTDNLPELAFPDHESMIVGACAINWMLEF